MQSDLDDAATARILTDDALHQLLASLTSNPHLHPPYPSSSHQTVYGEPNFPNMPQGSDHIPSHTGINWLGFSALEDSVAEDTPYDELRNFVAQKTLNFLNGDDELLDELDGQSNDYSSNDGEPAEGQYPYSS